MQLYRYFVGQSSEFCRHNPLCCFSMSNTKGKHIVYYQLSPETSGYTLIASGEETTNAHAKRSLRELWWRWLG